RCQNSGALTCFSQSRVGVRVAVEEFEGCTASLRRQNLRTVPFIQPSKWTPLVIWPIGTCSTGLSGYKQCHICRLTRPCSSLTALAERESLSASTVMQKDSCWLSGLTRPSFITSGNG